MLQENQGSLSYLDGGRLVTQYHYGDGGPWPVPSKPYFYPLVFDGHSMTRHVPKVGEPAEKDHPHHRSLYVAYGSVAGFDIWSEEPHHGFQKHQKFSRTWADPGSAGFEEDLVWESPEGESLLAEKRVFRMHPLKSGVRILDLESNLTAYWKPVLFGSTKEGGLCSLRVNEALRGDKGGLISNAHGLKREKECWGQRAAWTDYSGNLDGKALGMAMLDHPRNFRFPTFWHVRDYGLFTSNPFGHKDFKSAWTEDGSFLLKRGEALPFRYRILIHDGAGDEKALSAAWRDFAAGA